MKLYILAGRFKGRRLLSPRLEQVTRPTTGLVRKALFDLLADIIPGGSFLDLYAGTGAVGLEAASRGAGRILLVERDPAVCGVLRRNVRLIREDIEKSRAETAGLEVIQKPAEQAMASLAASGIKFNVVFADPPYHFTEARLKALTGKILEAGILNEDGILVLQHSSRFQPEGPPFDCGETRRYGSTCLTIKKFKSCPAAR